MDGVATNDDESTFAKESLGTNASEIKFLGIGWDKVNDNLPVTLTEFDPFAIKCIVLCTIH